MFVILFRLPTLILLIPIVLIGLPSTGLPQPLEKVLFTATNSEDMNQVLFRYGVEKATSKKQVSIWNIGSCRLIWRSPR